MEYKSFKLKSSRPIKQDRLFRSDVVEEGLIHISKHIKDKSLKKLFNNCLPNTLDTTTYYFEDKKGNPNTYVVTGDIPAMWIRDSTNQIWPYLYFINKDIKIKKLFQGLINKQAQFLFNDPYANAFIDRINIKSNIKPYWRSGKAWNRSVWERKYELDSIASFFRLSHGYYIYTKDTSPFKSQWLKSVKVLLATIKTEQDQLNKDNIDNLFRFYTPKGKTYPSVRMSGFGYPNKYTGLVRCLFRPSDDETVFPYIISSNAMMVVMLKNITDLLSVLRQDILADEVKILAQCIDDGIKKYGIFNHHKYGDIYGYEVDGFGSRLLMDDPNVPSLLSLPYIGYTEITDKIYLSTRLFILSEDNSFYVKGKVTSGLTSPHTQILNYFWPIATIMQALTTDNKEEIIHCIKVLNKTHAGTYFMHESVNVDNPNKYTRPWFGWANSMFGELIIHLYEKHPQILAHDFSIK